MSEKPKAETPGSIKSDDDRHENSHAGSPATVGRLGQTDPTKNDGSEAKLMVSQSELQKMVADATAKAVSEALAGRAAHAGVANAIDISKLPDQKDVDSSTIKASVLTKDGYVVPDSLGAPPPQAKRV